MPENEYGTTVVETKEEAQERHRLTNEDFRRLLMTPRSAPPATPSLVTPAHDDTEKTNEDPEADDRAERRRKKKSFYAKLKKQEEDKMAELAKKYRDRARERRDGVNPDYQSEDPMSTAGGYRAVAPDVKSGLDAAERRRQMIQESKFLGGDMEHTHLVKGLDYALLQKVRSEIQNKEQEEEDELEKIIKTKKERKDEEEEIHFKSKIGRNIYRAIFRGQYLERNELFAPGRLAYVIDLEDEFAESDIPTTLIRSKADVPSLESQTTLTTNDIVINKLAQILSYLRQGARNNKKAKKKDKGKGEEKSKPQEDSIYGEIGDYVPTVGRNERDRERDRDRDHDHHDRGRDHDRGRERDHRDKKRGSYFEKPSLEDDAAQEEIKDTAWAPVIGEGKIDNDGKLILENLEKSTVVQKPPSRSQQLLSRLAAEPEGYAECYPGLEEMQDAIEDSDDEVDYTKMDLGNKKGPIGRWDFDTQEEYSEYMNNKEALPKAAFQYGVKMADGRRTRKYHREKNEKAELDREWQKIQNIIQKRKANPTGRKEFGESDYKSARY